MAAGAGRARGGAVGLGSRRLVRLPPRTRGQRRAAGLQGRAESAQQGVTSPYLAVPNAALPQRAAPAVARASYYLASIIERKMMLRARSAAPRSLRHVHKIGKGQLQQRLRVYKQKWPDGLPRRTKRQCATICCISSMKATSMI